MTTLDLQQLLGPQGPVSRRLPGLRCAPRHLHLASTVAQALSSPHHLAVEAEPGTATRLAYLTAAILHLQGGAARGIISTRSPALQRQILEHDLPLLRSALPVEFSAASLKPRHHYLGLRRLGQTARRRDLLFSEPAHLEQLAGVQRWSWHAEDGSLSELASPPALAVWDRVKSEHGNCLGHRCPRHESCFYYEARRRAQSAHLVVVSHAALLSDRALRQRGASLLPDYDFVVVDESLALHAAACEHLGLRLSDRQAGLLLDALYDGRTGRGFLASYHAESAIESVAAARQAAGRLFGGLRTWQRLHGVSGGRCASPPAVDNPLSPTLRELQAQLGLLRDRLTTEEDLFELTALMDRCAATADLLEEILHQQREAHAYWICLEDGPGPDTGIVLHACPLEVRRELSTLLFQDTAAVVLVSPSLSLHGEDHACTYAKRRLGMTAGAVLRMEPAGRGPLEVLIEGHLPPPDLEGVFLPAACHCTAGHLVGAPGPALVVAPSWPAARAIAGHLSSPPWNLLVRVLDPQELRPDPQAGGISVVVDRLLEEITEPLDPVWKTLVLFRLPFESAAAPLVAARTEAIHARGGHAFREYQLPEALLRFKNCVRTTLSPEQGSALLIILDQRMVTRRYGRAFLDTLPGCRAVARYESGGPLKSLSPAVSS